MATGERSGSLHQIRVTGVLMEDGRVLLVRQRVSQERHWSLPGGQVETGETMEQALIREMREETGLAVEIRRLLYLTQKLDADPPLVHVTFQIERTPDAITGSPSPQEGGELPAKYVPIATLPDLGFGQAFVERAHNSFPDAGSYVTSKADIGLG